ncbi:acetyl esterase [Xylariaceae sp. FL1272]|nr:acetyl esterase [Xylariaceae sp. FL1272]
MPITSDITINVSRFHVGSITDETKQISAAIQKAQSRDPLWYEVGARRYNELFENGELGVLPRPVYLPGAKDEVICSRQAGRDIPVRVYVPDNGQPSRGLIQHLHGGGFTLFSHKDQDYILQAYANACQVTTISVGYRLAPEHPFPAGKEDCIDVAEYLVDHGEERYGAKLLFITGESAGAHLTVMTTFALIRSRPSFSLMGIILPYGQYSTAMSLPSMVGYEKLLVVNEAIIETFQEVYTPGWTIQQRQRPDLFPLYDDIQGLAASTPLKKLPPALFICGTDDPLLDDTLLLSVKWMATGSEGIVKVAPGGPHACNVGDTTMAKELFGYQLEFCKYKMGITG